MQISGTTGINPSDLIAGPAPQISPEAKAPIAAPAMDELPPASDATVQADLQSHSHGAGDRAYDARQLAEHAKRATEASSGARFEVAGHGADAKINVVDGASGQLVRQLSPHQFMNTDSGGLLLDVHS